MQDEGLEITELTPKDAKLITLMRDLKYGILEKVEVREGEPVRVEIRRESVIL